MGDSTNKTTGNKKKTSFFKGLKKEFRKVTWPDGKEIKKETIAVVVVSFALGIVIAILDFLVQIGIDKLTTF